jgi:hypothetical protein
LKSGIATVTLPFEVFRLAVAIATTVEKVEPGIPVTETVGQWAT